MNCDWAEKVSLLIDGELSPQDARAAEGHVETCAACRRAKEDFLVVRGQINSYPVAADREATRRALEKVLAAAAGTRDVSRGERFVREARASSSGRRAWSLPRLTPAFASALALLVLAAALGVVWTTLKREAAPTQVAEKTQPSEAAPQAAETHESGQTPTAPAESAQTSNIQVDEGGTAVKTVAQPLGERRGAPAPKRERTLPLGEGTRVTTASLESSTRGRSGGDALSEYAPLFDTADAVSSVYTPPDAGEVAHGGETARHFEQAQVLLRSFRNARPGTVADERARSQKLLYRNIVLRREAARSGEAFTERALDSLEPILMDIANLPERPGREEVAEVVERMRRKNIVAVLQANIAAAPRAY